MRSLSILVPAFAPSGPVKGAIALANALAGRTSVNLVALKPGPGADAAVDPRIEQTVLAPANTAVLARIAAYRALLRERGGRAAVTSLSMGFSGDFVNSFCGAEARIYASVRGNLLQNYRMDYGLVGIPLAMAHLSALRRFDGTVAMTRAMAVQMKFYSGARPVVIPNFVDEAGLEMYRAKGPGEGPLRFVYVGSLSRRKQPGLLVDALHELNRRGVEASLDLIGGGPLQAELARRIAALEVTGEVRLHGHLASPYPLIAGADAMVIPSLSEGTSRAALEALYLGVPCVLRDADGNSELITEGGNGILFRSDSELTDAMQAAALLARRESGRSCLLPLAHRQEAAALAHLQLFDSP